MQIAKQQRNEQLEQIRILKEENSKLLLKVMKLENTLDWFKRNMFGSKSERFIQNDQQCELGLDVKSTAVDEVFEEISYKRRKNNKKEAPNGHGRIPWPDTLRREKVEIKPDFDITGKKKIRDEITETLQYTPPEFWVLQEVRGVYVDDDAIDTEKKVYCPALPPRIIEKGSVGASVVAQLLVDKCMFHTPLYRLGRQWEAATGVLIPESNLYDWFSVGAFWLKAIRTLLLEKITSSGYVQLDESSIRVKVKGKKGKCHLGSMLVVHSPLNGMVVFTYRHSKDKGGAKEVLGTGFQGILQTDACPSYEEYASRDTILHAGCAAHSRRKFEESLKSDRDNAQVALEYYQDLFEIEADAKEKQLNAQQRLELRTERAAPLITEFKAWMDEHYADHRPKGLLGKALTYTLNHWDKLTRFLDDGRIELSNNWIENVIRLLAMGRKNFMFAGSVEGAHNLATVYSIMATCKLNSINPYEYCRDVLETLPLRRANEIEDLLPTNWKPSVDKQTLHNGSR